MPVSVGPGATALTRTPEPAASNLPTYFNGMLAADIDGRALGALMTVGRGDIDDAARALGRHHAQLVLQAEQHAEHVGVEGGGIARCRLLNHWTGFAFGAGVVDHGIEAPEALDRPVDETADIILVPHVGLDEFGRGAEFADRCLSGILPAAGNDDPVAPFRGRDRGRAGGLQ